MAQMNPQFDSLLQQPSARRAPMKRPVRSFAAEEEDNPPGAPTYERGPLANPKPAPKPKPPK